MSIEVASLFVVATPIGNLKDISARAIETLAGVDLIAAEDTRRTLQLLNHLGISRPLVSFHEHNEDQRIPGLLDKLTGGCAVALVSDAGTPLISDPGYRLVRAARAAGLPVVPIPGPSSPLAALSVSGIPADRFAFEGFLPSRPAARLERINELSDEPRTLVFLESGHRIAAALQQLADVFGADREALLAREMTKLHEEFRFTTLGGLVQEINADRNATRGELVLVVRARPAECKPVIDSRSRELLTLLLRELSASRAAALAAQFTKVPKRELYRLAVEIVNRRPGA